MVQAEVRVHLDAIVQNVRLLKARSNAEIMAVVKGDGYGHGMLPAARAALAGGATWLGACTLGEALTLRAAGITAPVFAWLLAPGQPLAQGIEAGVDLSVANLAGLTELLAAARSLGRPARVHLKVDTGLTRGGSTMADWPDLLNATARAQSEGAITVVGVWSHFACSDDPGSSVTDRQLTVFREALASAERSGIKPQIRHIANSAATITRPDAHFEVVRPGIAIYGLSPLSGEGDRPELIPAMTVRARVMQTKRVPSGAGVSYGHTYRTGQETTVAVVPLGYADGIPRAASNCGPVRVAGKLRRVAGRICMDQFVLDCGDDPVVAGQTAVLIGSDPGDPTADDWARVCNTINYEIVTRMGSSRIPRTYDGGAG